MAPSSGEEPASPRHRASAASMAWRSTRRFSTERAVKFDFHTARDEVVLAVAGARDGRSYERPRGLDDDAGQGEAGEAREAQLHRGLHGAPHPGVLVRSTSSAGARRGWTPVEGAVRTAASSSVATRAAATGSRRSGGARVWHRQVGGCSSQAAVCKK